MTASEWANCVNVMRLKWTNFHWDEETIKSVYNDLKGIHIKYVEKAIEQFFKKGTEFPPNPSQIYSTATEIMRYDMTNTDQPQIEYKGISLREFLKLKGWESVAEGMYHFGRARQLKGIKEVYETFDYSKEWNDGGKEAYIEHTGMGSSGLIKTLEQLDRESEDE
tara:strand:- start:533 stop:1027 length:495 start_codon:yes stop_codon:yes gene_type:complete